VSAERAIQLPQRWSPPRLAEIVGSALAASARASSISSSASIRNSCACAAMRMGNGARSRSRRSAYPQRTPPPCRPPGFNRVSRHHVSHDTADGAVDDPLSILELAVINEDFGCAHGAGSGGAISPRMRSAGGIHRFWLAEHHNMPGIATPPRPSPSAMWQRAPAASASVLAASCLPQPCAAGDRGAVWHAGLAVSGTYDLGVGRRRARIRSQCRCGAPQWAVESFPHDVAGVCRLSRPPQPGQRVHAVPGENTNVPAVDTRFQPLRRPARGAAGAAVRLRSHFAPDALLPALESSTARALSRLPSSPRPTRWWACASSQRYRRRGNGASRRHRDVSRIIGKRPVRAPGLRSDDIETYWSPMEKMQVMRMMYRSIIGSPKPCGAAWTA